MTTTTGTKNGSQIICRENGGNWKIRINKKKRIEQMKTEGDSATMIEW